MELFKQLSYGKRIWAYMLSSFGLFFIVFLSVIVVSQISQITGEIDGFGFLVWMLFLGILFLLGSYFQIKIGTNLYFWQKSNWKKVIPTLVLGLFFLSGNLGIIIGYIFTGFRGKPNENELYGKWEIPK